jgi:predicted nucleotidyltransferase
MRTNDPNIAIVEHITAALGDLMESLVLVGGCAAGLLITDPAQAAIRPTNDIDLIVETLSHADYYQMCDQLRAKGFQEVPEVICRWSFQGSKLDLMPSDPSILGFSNYWYPEALRSATPLSLPNGRSIRIVAAPVFIATKLVAFQNRGAGNYQASHDIEDIISVVDGRAELIDEFLSASEEVREYLDDEMGTLLGTPAFFESISTHLKPDFASQARHDLVVSRLRLLAGL